MVRVSICVFSICGVCVCVIYDVHKYVKKAGGRHGICQQRDDGDVFSMGSLNWMRCPENQRDLAHTPNSNRMTAEMFRI